MLIINKQNNPKILVIWLHGLGANSSDFKDFIKLLEMNEVEFILPDAPLIPITLNQGLKMPGWYDIKSLEFEEHDINGLNKTMKKVEKIVTERLKKMNRKIKVCLIGFSQGAAASLFFILNSHVKIDGVISLSGYIPYKKNRVVNPKIPMLALHGLHDDIINLDHAKESFNNFLDKENFKLITFNMGHEVIFEQLQHVKKFLKRI